MAFVVLGRSAVARVYGPPGMVGFDGPETASPVWGQSVTECPRGGLDGGTGGKSLGRGIRVQARSSSFDVGVFFQVLDASRSKECLRLMDGGGSAFSVSVARFVGSDVDIQWTRSA